MQILVLMYAAMSDEGTVTGLELMLLSIDRGREPSRDSINHLVNIAMVMRNRHTGMRGHNKLKNDEIARPLSLVYEESKFQIADPNGLHVPVLCDDVII